MLSPDLEKVESLSPADLHFQIFAKVKFQIKAFLLDFYASAARLLDTFSMSALMSANGHCTDEHSEALKSKVHEYSCIRMGPKECP